MMAREKGKRKKRKEKKKGSNKNEQDYFIESSYSTNISSYFITLFMNAWYSMVLKQKRTPEGRTGGV
jgi:hypothetical protein